MIPCVDSLPETLEVKGLSLGSLGYDEEALGRILIEGAAARGFPQLALILFAALFFLTSLCFGGLLLIATAPFQHAPEVGVGAITPREVLPVVRILGADALSVDVGDIGKRIQR